MHIFNCRRGSFPTFKKASISHNVWHGDKYTCRELKHSRDRSPWTWSFWNNCSNNPTWILGWPNSPFYMWPKLEFRSLLLQKVRPCICRAAYAGRSVCAPSRGLGDYVDKRCTWCFRLSFSPPLPPFNPSFIPLSSFSLAISNITLGLLKD